MRGYIEIKEDAYEDTIEHLYRLKSLACKMIKKLQEYASVELSGASGKKFMENRALEIVKKAIDGKDGVPYTDFDDIYDKGLMEPTFELNRDYTKGY